MTNFTTESQHLDIIIYLGLNSVSVSGPVESNCALGEEIGKLNDINDVHTVLVSKKYNSPMV